VARAQAKLERVLGRVDRFIDESGLQAPEPEPPRSLDLPAESDTLDLRARGIRTVLWATGFRRTYPFLGSLKDQVLDARGELRHDQGTTTLPGLYAVGLLLQSRRSSSFIDGVGHDAQAIARHIQARLENRALRAA
jgi:putative flavoprotein involved in K+ transport